MVDRHFIFRDDSFQEMVTFGTTVLQKLFADVATFLFVQFCELLWDPSCTDFMEGKRMLCVISLADSWLICSLCASSLTVTRLFTLLNMDRLNMVQPVVLYQYIIIQDVPGGMCQTSGGCSLC